MLVYKRRADSDIKLASAFSSLDACIQASGRFLWTALYIHTTVSEDRVVHQMLAKKRRGDFRGPFVMLMKLFLKTGSCAKCLSASFRAILVHRSLCL